MFTWPLKRGCYQPWSRCMFSFTCTGIQCHIDTHARTHSLTKRLFRTLTHTHAHARPPLSGPVEGHAFVSRCQDAGVCSCASYAIRFILLSRGCPFVCGRVSFQPTPISPQEDTSVSVVLQAEEWKAQTPPVRATVVPQHNL